MKRNISIILIGIAIFLFFYVAYLKNAFPLYISGAFDKWDLLFDADVPRVINDIANFGGNHYRTLVHPLFVLLVNPIGSLCVKIFSKPSTSVAIGINSFFGALGVVLAYAYFLLKIKNLIFSLLFSIFFGFSMSQMFWSSVPETYALGVCSLLLSYILFEVDYSQKVIHKRLWILAGLFTTAVVTTNFIQTLILFFFTLMNSTYEDKKWSTIIFRIIQFASKVMMLTIVLAVIQKMIYPSSNFFFDTQKIYNEVKAPWTTCLWLNNPFKVILQLIKDLFFVNIFAPIPNIYYLMSGLAVTFSGPLKYLPIGWLGIAIWAPLLIAGFARGFKEVLSKSERSNFFIATGLCLLFEGLLHSCYGWREDRPSTLFLYSGYYTFLTIIIASLSFKKINFYSYILLATLCILAILNNNLVYRFIISLYD